jgi:hypothetical protein
VAHSIYGKPSPGKIIGRKYQANAKSQDLVGWQRQAESSELGDGGFPVRRTIAKAFGLDAATRLTLPMYPFRDFAIAPAEIIDPGRSSGHERGKDGLVTLDLLPGNEEDSGG